MTDKAWTQLLLMAVPVLALVGSWLALRAVGGRGRRRDAGGQDADEHDEAKDQ